jgi:hypothetical protein
MTAWFDRPVTAWAYTSAGGGVPGPALSPALLAEEARDGATRDVVWAYADALPLLLGDAINADVTPLGFARGRLTAAVVEAPVLVPGLEYVQTRSPEVCLLYAASVPRFKVVGRPCVEALARAGGAVRHVDVFVTEPFAIDAGFALHFQWGGPDPAPRWYHPLPTAAYLIPVARLDEDVWLCWDRDHHRARIFDGHGRFHEARLGPRDVQPEPAPPPWTADAAPGGEGWAATAMRVGGRAASMIEARDRHWLSRSSFDGDARSTFVSLDLDGAAARFEWIGLHRLLRVRAGRIEQLTVDHDLRWQAARSGLTDIPEDAFAAMVNVVAKALPDGEPDHGICDVASGDRFVLLDAATHRLLADDAHGELAALLGRGSVRQVARWIRSVLLRADHRDAAIIVDADAAVEPRVLPSPPAQVEAVTVNDLVHQPARYHRRRIRCRGIFHAGFERMRFADAWFRCAPALPDGAWLVDAEGEWQHDGTGRGHLGQCASELVGTATIVSIADPRVVPASQIRGARPYVPLRSEVMLEQRMQGWTLDGNRWLHRLGRDARLPAPAFPAQARATITWMVDGFRELGLFAWTIHDTSPLVPEDAEPTDPLVRGRLVVVQGILRWPETRDWPALDGAMRVVPPSLARSHQRYAVPDARWIEAARDRIGATTLVTVVGEMADRVLFALSIESTHGPIDV